MNAIERMMHNPDWDPDKFFFVRIDIVDGEFEAKLHLDTSVEGELHTFAETTATTIAGALESLNALVSEQVVADAAGHFLEKSLLEEEEELKA